MQMFWEVIIISWMFLIRLGVPIALLFLVGYGLRRLDARWYMQALERRHQLESTGVCEAPGYAASPAQAMSLIQEPCWEYRACSETTRARCPAYLQPRVPCWIARRQASGRLPSSCGQCSIFTTARRIRMGAAV